MLEQWLLRHHPRRRLNPIVSYRIITLMPRVLNMRLALSPVDCQLFGRNA
ncbi:hypothetical protein HMPREF0620_1204 [Parascardovia denticolens DSM 10105 = JCM 12538]|uniref:Uncharacterized protein n=1 Tax=Parascardovia denticolens DSM 10105 = JCM 12538 TaxID=864564 RepID=E6K0C6_PARDN|nr:hypothetical protein HMPREF0620_1204 [Parascardovia denticolens DSM 10105 = JCM 12538]